MCCFYPTGDKDVQGRDVMKSCRFLVKLGEKRYACRIYNNRLGTFIGMSKNGKKWFCQMYNDLQYEIKGCPLNEDNKWKKPIMYDLEIDKSVKIAENFCSQKLYDLPILI